MEETKNQIMKKLKQEIKDFKNGLMPIETPIGNYCCGNGRICTYFGMDAINEECKTLSKKN